MRICLVTREYPPVTSYSGGIGTQFAGLAPELARLGHDVHVLTIADEHGDPSGHDGIRLHLVKRPQLGKLWPVRDVLWDVALDRALRKLGRFDLVFAPEWGGDLWLYARHKRSGPLVTNLTTSLDQILVISPERPDWRGLKVHFAIQRRLERVQSQRSDALMACSHAILDWARELWGIETIPSVVVPFMVDSERARRLARGELPAEFPRERPVVVFSGRLEQRKGVDVLVEAMHQVWQELPTTQLVLAGHDLTWGGGMTSDHLRRLAGPYADRLHLPGFLPPERLFPVLAAADVLAFPSRWEAFGIATLEAMALGKPMVATSGSGYDDYFRDGIDGLMVPGGAARPLAAALKRLLEDRELGARFGAAAAERAEQFGTVAVTARHVEAFEAFVATA